MNLGQVRKQFAIYLFFICIGAVLVYAVSTEQWKGLTILPGVCVIIGVFLLLQKQYRFNQILTGLMYVLIAATFLNQSVFSIHIGFFSLFLYRLLLLMAAGIVLIMIFKNQHLLNDWRQSSVKHMLSFLLFWLVYGVISLMWVKSLTYGIKYMFLLSVGIAFVFLTVFTFKKRKQLQIFYQIWIVMTVLLMVIGWINYFAHIQLHTSTLYGASAYQLSYPTAVFFNQNDFATFLTISFFFYLSAVKNKKNIYYKGVMLLFALSALLLIHYTESRASMLGIMAGGMFYLFLMLPGKWKKYTSLMGITVIAVLAVCFMQKIYDKLMIIMASSNLHDGATPLSSNLVRVNLVKSTWHYLLESHGFGVGAGNIPFYLKYQSIFNTNHVVEAHNWFMEIAGNFGFVIALGYILLYTVIFYQLYCTYQESQLREDRLLLEGLLTAQIGFIVSSISPSSVSNLYFHWVFIGLLITTISVYKQQKELPWHQIKRGANDVQI